MSQVEGSPAYQQARTWRDKRNLFAAKQFIEIALAANPTGAELARVRLTAGAIYRELGDLALALQHLEALIKEWDQYPQERPLLEGFVLYNLALVHRQRRNYTESIRLNQLAADEFAKESMRHHRVRALQNMAWSLCHLGDSDEAVNLLNTIETEKLIDSDDTEAYWQQRIGYCFTSYVDGGYKEVLNQAEFILKQDDAPADVLSQAACLAGKSGLALGLPNEALRLADVASEWAIKANDSRCMGDAQALRREAILKAKEGRGA